MRAWICDRLDGPQALRLEEVPPPSIKDGHVLVEARAWGINFADVLMSRGAYQTRLELPFVAGCEVSGVVIEVGAGVPNIKVGMPVAALAPCGAFADQVLAASHRVLPLASSMDFATGAGFYSGYTTAMHGLTQRGNLKAEETLLVLAAGGGTGFAAVDIGAALGAQVIAVASSADKLVAAAQRGASIINYRSEDVSTRIREMTGGADVDVVFDPVGGDLFDAVSRRVRWNGRYLVVGFASGRIPTYPANLCLVKGCALVGVFTDDFMRREPDMSHSNVIALNALFNDGRLAPRISTVTGLDALVGAIVAVESGEVDGKLVVTA